MGIETVSLVRMSALFFCAFSNLFFTFIIWKKAKDDKTAFHLGFVAFFSFLFAFTYGMVFFPGSDKLFWSRATWVGVFIVPAYLNFIFALSGKTKNLKQISFVCYFFAVLINILALTTSYVVVMTHDSYPYDDEYGIAALIARIYVAIGLLVSVFYLISTYFKIDTVKKERLKYLILGISIYTFGGVFAAGVLPLFFPAFNFVDISAYASIPFISLTTYAIIKKQLFDIKVILTETLTYSFFIFLLGQVVFNNFFPVFYAQLINLVFFSPVAYLLIKASRAEVRKNEVLEEKVAERTKDLRSSNQALEQSKKVAEDRAQELEKWYNLTVGRELRMAELKSQIKELEGKTK